MESFVYWYSRSFLDTLSKNRPLSIVRRILLVWWSRRESNSRPKDLQRGRLQFRLRRNLTHRYDEVRERKARPIEFHHFPLVKGTWLLPLYDARNAWEARIKRRTRCSWIYARKPSGYWLSASVRSAHSAVRMDITVVSYWFLILRFIRPLQSRPDQSPVKTGTTPTIRTIPSLCLGDLV